MIKVINKGYTLSVKSWENDGDNYRTQSKTFDTKEEAVKIAKMCNELFCSCNNGGTGIGNTCEGEEDEARETILDYLEDNPNFFDNQSEMDDDTLIDEVMYINNSLMGGSEFYYSRVCESVTLTYSPDGIFLEEIKF